MAGSPFESGISSPSSGSRHGSRPRPWGIAPSGSPGAAGLLWTAAFALATCAVLVLVFLAVLGAGPGNPGTVAGAAASLLLLITLIALRLKDGAGDDVAAAREWRAEAPPRRAAELERHGDERQAQYNGTAPALAEAADYLVHVQLPAALNGSAVPRAFPDAAAGGNAEVAALCNRVAAAVAEGAAKLLEQLDDQVDDQIESSRLAVVTLARRVQASAHRIQEEATRMAARHPADSDVLESSMRVDHAAAQQARHAQSVAVLCGEWPGQQWPQPLALLDVVRAASSRIVAYRRVTVSGEPDVAATASAVEPLIHLVAELLANATQSSPPTTQVLVTVRTVQRGAVIEMDDGGVGMEEHQLDQAREVISGRRLLRLGDLGEVPQTGMAVIGQYVRRHGFRVDLMQSPYGGVRAIVLVPAEMVEILEPAATPTPRPLPAAVSVRGTGEAGTGSLPQRVSRRGESAPAAHGEPSPGEPSPGEPPPPAPAPATQTPEQAGAWMAAYFSGSAGAPEAAGSTPADGSTAASAEPGHAAAGRLDPLSGRNGRPGNEQA